jgi:hypothetical protein
MAVMFGCFFAESIPANIARRLLAYILTEKMEHNPQLGLDSSARLFPNQDTLPRELLAHLI